MFDLIIDKFHDTRFMAMLFAAVAAIATVMTLAMPLLAPDTLNKRLKSVAVEREKIRQREREKTIQTHSGVFARHLQLDHGEVRPNARCSSFLAKSRMLR